MSVRTKRLQTAKKLRHCPISCCDEMLYLKEGQLRYSYGIYHERHELRLRDTDWREVKALIKLGRF